MEEHKFHGQNQDGTNMPAEQRNTSSGFHQSKDNLRWTSGSSP